MVTNWLAKGMLWLIIGLVLYRIWIEDRRHLASEIADKFERLYEGQIS